MFPPHTWQDLEQIVEHRHHEGPSLEFKRNVALIGDKARRELLKDLTGMGNGGGGLLIFGIAEDPAAEGVAAELTPLRDNGLPGVLEDIARSTIRPPLLATYRRIEGPDGFVLVVDVARSVLGPYMVEGYVDRRYYHRQGTRTAPMSEQQVRDLYMLSARARENRDAEWDRHKLPPVVPSAKPWLLVSALPEAPYQELLDITNVDPHEYGPEEIIRDLGEHANMAELRRTTNNMRRWSDGIFAEDSYEDRPPHNFFRMHRHGAVGIAQELDESILTVPTIER